jgi:hypothetical protein
MALPLPAKPPAGSTINTGHSIASGLVRCVLLNEGSGTAKELVGSGNGTLSGDTIWTTDADMGGTCITNAGAVNGGVDFGQGGLSHGNGSVSVFFGIKILKDGNYHNGGAIAGAGVNTYTFGLHGSPSNPFLWVNRGVVEVQSTIGPVATDDVYTVGIAFTQGVQVRFHTFRHNTDATVTETIATTAGSSQISATSNVAAGDGGGNPLRKPQAFLYIWNRVVADSEFVTLHANPYAFINQAGELPFITTIDAKRI